MHSFHPLRNIRLGLLCLFLVTPFLHAFPPPQAGQAFDAAVWVVAVNLGTGKAVCEMYPRLPEGDLHRLEAYNDGTILEAKVLEVLKAPAGERSPGRFSIYDSVVFSSSIEHAESNRRMVLFLVPAKIKGILLAKYPELKSELRWEVLRAFAIDAQEPNGQDNLQGLRALAKMKGCQTVKRRLACVKQVLRSTPSMLAASLALDELEALYHTQKFTKHDEASSRPDSQWQQAIPKLLSAAGARWAADKGESAWRRKRIALALLTFAQRLGATPDPDLVLQLMGGERAPLNSSAMHLLDKDSLDKVLARVRACVHGQDEDLAEAAMQKLAEFYPGLLEEDLQSDDVPSLRNVRGQEMLVRKSYLFHLPRRHLDLQEVEPLLRSTIAKARDGDLFLLQCELHRGLGLYRLITEPWRRALRLLESMLNDPLPDRAATVVAAFRTNFIPLRLEEGKYIPDYDGKALPPVSLHGIPPQGAWLMDVSPQIIEMDEVFLPDGQLVELNGTWHIWAYQESNTISTWMSVPDSMTNAVTGTRRSRLDLNGLLKSPGYWELTIGKMYDRDDRKNGGSWTGIVWAEAIPVKVE